MVKTCIVVIDNFKKSLSFRNPYNPGDGGYNYIKQLRDLLSDLEQIGIKVNWEQWNEDGNEYTPNYIEFKTTKQAEKIYNKCRFLSGTDGHFFSCFVEVKQDGKKVIYNSSEW